MTDQQADRIIDDIRAQECYGRMCTQLAGHWARRSYNLHAASENFRQIGDKAFAQRLAQQAEDANTRADGYLTQALLARTGDVV